MSGIIVTVDMDVRYNGGSDVALLCSMIGVRQGVEVTELAEVIKVIEVLNS